MYNSTIRLKIGYCELCADGKKKPLTKSLCETHYWQSVKMKSVQKFQDQDIQKEQGLPELIADADAVFSRFIRLSAANEKGILHCYICNTPVHYKQADAMHYIKRGNLFLRYDIRNVKAGCKDCNQVKGGNYILFAKKLEQEHPGITEILFEESALVYKPSREEIRLIISEYSTKFKNLLRCHN